MTPISAVEPLSRSFCALLAISELGIAVCRVAHTALYGVGATQGVYQYNDWVQQFSATVSDTVTSLFVSTIYAIGTLFPQSINRWRSFAG